MHKRSLILLGCLLLAIVGCKEAPKTTDALRIYLPGDPTSLDPHVGLDRRCRTVQGALLEGLTRRGLNGKLELALASKVDVSEDQKTYTFHLKEAKWSNGKQVVAQDFVDTWQRAVAPGSGCKRADMFYLIKNGKKIKQGAAPLESFGAQALPDNTLQVELECVAPYFLEMLANPLFYPYLDDEKTFVGNGPFVLKNWEHEKKMELVANPTYWDAQTVKLKKMDIAMVRDENTVLLMYEKGELDWAGRPFRDLPEESIESLEREGKIQKKEVNEVFWLALNTDIPPLNSPFIRKALSIALDRKQLAKLVLGGNIASRSLFPERASPLGERNLYKDGDIKQAQALFQEGLQELGLSLEEVPPLVINHSDQLLQRKMAQALAQEWERIFKIKVVLQGDQWPVLFEKLNTRQFTIGGCWWWAIHTDPIGQLEMFTDKDSPFNITNWEDKEFANLVKCASKEKVGAKRDLLLKEAEKCFFEHMPVIPLVSHQFKYVKSERVQDVVISPSGQIDFKWAHLN